MIPATFDPAIFTVKALAVVGGAVLGGLAVGTLTRFLIKRAASRKLTDRTCWVMRGLGAVLFGWLTALILFGGGGGYGLGGTGGWGFGGTGLGPGGTGPVPPTPTDTEKEKSPGPEDAAPRSQELVVEILAPPALERLYGNQSAPERCYRMVVEGGPRLLSLVELKSTISERLHTDPPLNRVELVLYKDSPERRTPRVAELRRWLGDLPTLAGRELKIDLREPDSLAPAR